MRQVGSGRRPFSVSRSDCVSVNVRHFNVKVLHDTDPCARPLGGAASPSVPIRLLALVVSVAGHLVLRTPAGSHPAAPYT